MDRGPREDSWAMLQLRVMEARPHRPTPLWHPALSILLDPCQTTLLTLSIQAIRSVIIILEQQSNKIAKNIRCGVRTLVL